MDRDDRAAHFESSAGDICKAAAIGRLEVEVVTRDGEVIVGAGNCRPGDPVELLRIGRRELGQADVQSIRLWRP